MRSCNDHGERHTLVIEAIISLNDPSSRHALVEDGKRYEAHRHFPIDVEGWMRRTRHARELKEVVK